MSPQWWTKAEAYGSDFDFRGVRLGIDIFQFSKFYRAFDIHYKIA